MHHWSAGEDDAEVGELNKRRGAVDVEAVGGRQGRKVVFGVVAEEDDDGGDAAEAVEVRGWMDAVSWFMVGEEAVREEGGEEGEEDFEEGLAREEKPGEAGGGR